MKRICLAAALVLLGTTVSAQAQDYDLKAEAATFDRAVDAGRVKVDGATGAAALTSVTTGCSTRLVAGSQSWTIDWTTSFISEDSTNPLLIKMDGGKSIALAFGDEIALGSALLSGGHLGLGCEDS